jgi:hypothetical protein
MSRHKIHGTELNFDEWRVLAETDPDEFERRRSDVLEAFIAETPDAVQPHLRRLQWRIDMERRYHWRNPLVATRKIYEMMWSSVYGEDGLLTALQRLTEGTRAAVDQSREVDDATVLKFRSTAKPQ